MNDLHIFISVFSDRRQDLLAKCFNMFRKLIKTTLIKYSFSTFEKKLNRNLFKTIILTFNKKYK